MASSSDPFDSSAAELVAAVILVAAKSFDLFVSLSGAAAQAIIFP